MKNNMRSLNIATSVGIILAESLKQLKNRFLRLRVDLWMAPNSIMK